MFHPGSKVVACERQSLEMSCQAGERIHVVEAAYGRSNNVICPTHWQPNTLCLANNSLSVVSNRWVFFLSKYGCDDRFSGAMIERGVLLQPQIQSLGIRALALASTLKSCTPASPTLRRNLSLKWTNQASTLNKIN